ncbi:MAG: tRNA (adenosine(37)-N6)-dimethylallyltransferase MiaA [Termitinemataceae bacterium]|nr:MAG: tRNA (adenosine(37)-N6)-dimethylallyltransferase MiaA [Termitinemataceae bacterium]
MKTLVIFGPTGSGKTELLKYLFTGSKKICDAEIISADSMQVYKGLDIGTAKPDAEYCAELPHHLISIKEPNEQFNAGDFARMAKQIASEITARGALPVVSGGTGFYLKTLIEGLPPVPPADLLIRAELKAALKKYGAESLIAELKQCDPISAARINVNDQYRVLRALEVFRLSGKPLSSFAVKHDSEAGSRHNKFLLYGIERERTDLYDRINKRCALMFKEGLAEEVAALFNKGFTPDDPALKAIGYREFFTKNENDKWKLVPYSNDTLTAVQDLVAQNSRRYAKRQITWFKKVENVRWLNPTEFFADLHNLYT